MNRQDFSVELLDEMGIAAGGDAVVSDEIYDQRRWADVRRIVFQLGDEYWQVDYFSASTEMQESGWGYGTDPEFVEAVKVEPVEVTVTRYRPVSLR